MVSWLLSITKYIMNIFINDIRKKNNFHWTDTNGCLVYKAQHYIWILHSCNTLNDIVHIFVDMLIILLITTIFTHHLPSHKKAAEM